MDNKKYFEKLEKSLKQSKNTSGWIRCLKNKETNVFYLVGYGGMGSLIFMEMKDEFRQDYLQALIEEQILIEGETRNYWEVRENLTSYHHKNEIK